MKKLIQLDVDLKFDLCRELWMCGFFVVRTWEGGSNVQRMTWGKLLHKNGSHLGLILHPLKKTKENPFNTDKSRNHWCKCNKVGAVYLYELHMLFTWEDWPESKDDSMTSHKTGHPHHIRSRQKWEKWSFWVVKFVCGVERLSLLHWTIKIVEHCSAVF